MTGSRSTDGDSTDGDRRPLDLTVVGAGPCGISAGAAARRDGRHHGRKIVARLTEGREAAAAVETGVEASPQPS